jgi:uncharacterized membrane protein
MKLPKATFGLEENIASAATYVLTWVTGIIFILVEKENKTVRFHAWQSILTFLPLQIIIYIIGWFLWMFYFIVWILDLLMLILWLVLIIKAYQGEKFKLPIVGDIAENQVK